MTLDDSQKPNNFPRFIQKDIRTYHATYVGAVAH